MGHDGTSLGGSGGDWPPSILSFHQWVVASRNDEERIIRKVDETIKPPS